MNKKRLLTEQEEKDIFKAIDDFHKYRETQVTCPICQGKLEYQGNYYSSYAISCVNHGVLYSIRGL